MKNAENLKIVETIMTVLEKSGITLAFAVPIDHAGIKLVL